MKKILFVLLLLILPCVALADAGTSSTATVAVPVVSPDAPSALFDAVSTLGKAFSDKNWTLLVAALLTLFIIGARWFELAKKVPAEYVPWVTLLLATGTSVALGLQTKQSLGTILTTGVLVGIAAIGGWESFGKLIRGIIRKLRGSSGAPAAPTPPPAGG